MIALNKLSDLIKQDIEQQKAGSIFDPAFIVPGGNLTKHYLKAHFDLRILLMEVLSATNYQQDNAHCHQ